MPTYPHWLTFEVKTETQGPRGAPKESWATAFQTWGSYEPGKGGEWPRLGTQAQMEQARRSQALTLFRIRYRSGVGAATHRVQFGGKVWDIKDVRVMPEGRPFELHIDAQAIS